MGSKVSADGKVGEEMNSRVNEVRKVLEGMKKLQNAYNRYEEVVVSGSAYRLQSCMEQRHGI